jgi:hypothetical protein
MDSTHPDPGGARTSGDVSDSMNPERRREARPETVTFLSILRSVHRVLRTGCLLNLLAGFFAIVLVLVGTATILIETIVKMTTRMLIPRITQHSGRS